MYRRRWCLVGQAKSTSESKLEHAPGTLAQSNCATDGGNSLRFEANRPAFNASMLPLTTGRAWLTTGMPRQKFFEFKGSDGSSATLIQMWTCG
jgi:hypothetical protein